MASINKVILIGNLGRDPEFREFSGGSVANVGLATTEKWKDKQGQPQEETTWHNLVFWNRQAEVAAKYLRKGSQVYIEGSIKTEEYDKDGVTMRATKIKVHNFQMLGGNPNKRGTGHEPGPPQTGGSTPPQDFDDDIPF